VRNKSWSIVCRFTSPVLVTVVNRQFASWHDTTALLYPEQDPIGIRDFFSHPFDIRLLIMIGVFSEAPYFVVTKIAEMYAIGRGGLHLLS
jgi:hypothetical protein